MQLLPRSKCLVFVLLPLLGAGGVNAQQGAVTRVHDPVLIREKDTYYVFCSGKGVPVRRSSDLVHWEQAGRVFTDDVPAWAKPEVPGARDVWAPDISYWNGTFHLYYSISTMGSQRSCIGVATNKTLDQTSKDFRWVDHGKVTESFPGKMDYNCIDSNLVLDDKGQPWLAFGSYWMGLRLIRLDPKTGKASSQDTRVYPLAARPPDGAIEAVFIVLKNGWYYLFCSYDMCCEGVGSTYKVMVGRSRQITGPYVDYVGKPMLQGNATTVLAGNGYCRGPGHNGILLDRGGDWMVNHMYDARARGIPTMQIRPILWAADGWPVVGEPVGESATTQPHAPTAADVQGVWSHSVNFRADEYIDLRPGGRMESPVRGSTWSLEGSVLRIRWPIREAPDGFWTDTCTILPDGRSYVGRNQKGDLIRGAR
jgi:arabinan endo-1,5-alpha-L-arabinosidase